MKNESGFTLIELIVTTAIIAILAAIALSGFSIYQKRAFDAHADQMIHDAAVSLEAAINSMPDQVGNFWAWTDASGTLQGPDINTMLPGMKISPDTRLWASLNLNCGAAFGCPPDAMCCMEASITAMHCKGKNSRGWMRFNNGTTMEWTGAAWGC